MMAPKDNRQNKPKWIFKLLESFCPPHLLEEIEGDLIQKFEQDLKFSSHSKWSEDYKLRRAKRRLFWNVIRFFRPEIVLRNKRQIGFTQISIFQNYFKTTYRHLLKNKINFFFKLGGLTLALFSFLVIAIYVSFQLSFDTFHENYENIYRVNSQWMENEQLSSYAVVPPGVGPTLKSELPEIESYARMGHPSKYLIKYQDKSFRFNGFTEADSTIFDVLTFRFLRGTRQAFHHPGSIILTQSLAEQIFGDEDPLGKSISFTDRSNKTFEITALIEDLPPNSHLDIKALLPYEALKDSADLYVDPWEISIDGSVNLYIRLRKDADAKSFRSKAEAIIRKNIKERSDGLDKTYQILLQPIRDIYLDDPLQVEFNKKGNSVYVYIFSLLGVFLLIIASINYVNLSIADFHKRTKEIGIRKVFGARKKQIAFQVAFETLLYCFLALVLSTGILIFIFPELLQRLEPNLSLDLLRKPKLLSLISIALIALIFFSTLYPAYQLSRNEVAMDLKVSTRLGRNSTIGQTLLLTQFIISIVCITGTFIVAKQVEFIHSKNPGYDRHNVAVLFMPDRYPEEKIPVMKTELLRIPGVERVSYSTFLIAGGGYYKDWYRVEENNTMKPVQLNEVFFDHDFFDVMGVPLVAGRKFDVNNPSDSHSAFIINEAAVKELGWSDPIGKRIGVGYEEPQGEKWEGTVVGVMKDYNIYSFKEKIEPLVMRLPWSDWPGQCLYVRMTGPIEPTLASIKKKYEEVLPDFTAEYHLIDNLYERQYREEAKAYSVLQIVTWIIVMISALGIFSLSIYLSVSRMKEFGIRKVLGATMRQIAQLHMGYFMRLVVLANIISLPIAYWLINGWLETFAYRIEMTLIPFILVVVITALLVVISAGYSSWKAARMNPVDVIKGD